MTTHRPLSRPQPGMESLAGELIIRLPQHVQHQAPLHALSSERLCKAEAAAAADAAAAAAGRPLIEMGSRRTHEQAAVAAARAWVEAHPEAPEAASILFNTERVQAILEFGRDFIGFGLYLLRNPD